MNRREVLRLAHARYQAAAQPDHVAAAHCLLHLGDVAGLADLLIQVHYSIYIYHHHYNHHHYYHLCRHWVMAATPINVA